MAISLGNDQPGVAARIAYRNAGVVIPLKNLSANRLRRAARAVLNDDRYRLSARGLQSAIREADGLKTATDLIENAFGCGRAAAVMPSPFSS